jgi:hypothetical protein
VLPTSGDLPRRWSSSLRWSSIEPIIHFSNDTSGDMLLSTHIPTRLVPSWYNYHVFVFVEEAN